MAYYSSSNYGYDHYHDNNYQYYQPYYNNNYDLHESSRYVHHQYYSDHTQYYSNAYQQVPTESLVGYYSTPKNNNYEDQLEFFASKNANFHEKSDYFHDPVSTQFVISYSNAAAAATVTKADELEFEKHHPEPYHGGYDIHQTYGKSLPPSDDICYPPNKIDPNNYPFVLDHDSLHFKGIPSPYGKEGQILEGKPNPKPISDVIIPISAEAVQEDNVLDSDEDVDEDEYDEDYEDEDEDEDEVDDGKIVENLEGETKPANVTQEENVSKIEEEESRGESRGDEGGNGKEIRRQIPAGYGLEAVGICEGLFGGYFPCLMKRNKRGNCDQCGHEVKKKMDDYECWQGTVDYLFGNPNPYGGAMPEKGSYGDPVYSYQRYHPQQSISGQVHEFGENSSWLHNNNLHSSSKYYYGHE